MAGPEFGDRVAPRLHAEGPEQPAGHALVVPRRPQRAAGVLPVRVLRHLHRRAVRAARRPGQLPERRRPGARRLGGPPVRPEGLVGRAGLRVPAAVRLLAARRGRAGVRRVQRRAPGSRCAARSWWTRRAWCGSPRSTGRARPGTRTVGRRRSRRWRAEPRSGRSRSGVRARSSAGEHSAYTRAVAGSNPAAPTRFDQHFLAPA